MQETKFASYVSLLRLASVVILCAAAFCYGYKTIGWHVMWDSSAMHYVNFLIDHGKTPYRDIIDFNMPGAYFIESWAMHVFGGGDLGWRLYDFSLLGLMTASCIVIAWPYDWIAGLFAGVTFALIHGLEGPRNAAQREQVMATLILMGYALLFLSARKRKPLLMLPFGFLMGLAASLKPTALPLGIVLLLMLVYALKQKSVPVFGYCSYCVAGLISSLAISVVFVLRYHVLGDFLEIGHRLLPYYAGVANAPLSLLLMVLFLGTIGVALLIGLLLAFANPSHLEWENWERWTLVLGICFGAASYLVQRKTFEHHAYTFEIFVLLWFALECLKAMRAKGWIHAVALASFAVGVLYFVPRSAHRLLWLRVTNEVVDTLQGDLTRLGGSQLQNQVLCLDIVSGCLSALYRLDLVQNTGLMGDYMFFASPGQQGSAYYKNELWKDLHKDPPKVIVLTNQWLSQGNSFKKIDQWPELVAFLNEEYRVDVTRTFSGDVAGTNAYRIYVLKPNVSHQSP